MSVEYRYYNRSSGKFIDLGKDFCIASNAWRDIFYDFRELNECYSVDSMIDIIKKPLQEHERFCRRSQPDYELNWESYDSIILKCATKIYEFLSSDIPENFYAITDGGILTRADQLIDDDQEETKIYQNIRKPENLIWSRY